MEQEVLNAAKAPPSHDLPADLPEFGTSAAALAKISHNSQTNTNNKSADSLLDELFPASKSRCSVLEVMPALCLTDQR